MGYQLFAFIAPKGTFDEIKSQSPYVTVAALNQGFELMLNDWYLEAVLPHPIDQSTPVGFEDTLLDQSLIDMCLDISERHTIAYIVADFFGGVGSQFAVAWKDRQVISLPKNNHVFGGVPGRNGAINTVLRTIGIQATEIADEFGAIGLHKQRHPEAWFAAATGFDSMNYFDNS